MKVSPPPRQPGKRRPTATGPYTTLPSLYKDGCPPLWAGGVVIPATDRISKATRGFSAPLALVLYFPHSARQFPMNTLY